jgi:hypothetical protein
VVPVVKSGLAVEPAFGDVLPYADPAEGAALVVVEAVSLDLGWEMTSHAATPPRASRNTTSRVIATGTMLDRLGGGWGTLWYGTLPS